MNDNLLYFPYINIPKNNWTIKSLLYWDRVGVIVPPNFIETPSSHDKYTIDLLRTDLIEQVLPYEYTYKVQNFDNGLLAIINNNEFNIEQKQFDFKAGRISKIHFQKFGEELLNKLIYLGLATRKPNDWQWYYVESKTASIIMIYLASVIGQIGNFTPATDNIRNIDLSLNQNKQFFKRSMIRHEILDNLIPYPIEPDLTKLRLFKDKYHDELKSFRILLEQTVLSVSTNKNSNLQREILDMKVEEINDKKEKIYRELTQVRIGQIVFGTMFGLTGALISFANDINTLGLFSLGNAIYSAFQGYDNSNILNRDYSYLALVDKNFKTDRTKTPTR
jgi:hypothetical protein